MGIYQVLETWISWLLLQAGIKHGRGLGPLLPRMVKVLIFPWLSLAPLGEGNFLKIWW